MNNYSYGMSFGYIYFMTGYIYHETWNMKSTMVSPLRTLESHRRHHRPAPWRVPRYSAADVPTKRCKWNWPTWDLRWNWLDIPGITNWKYPPFLMGKLTISTGPFSIAMLNYQRVSRDASWICQSYGSSGLKIMDITMDITMCNHHETSDCPILPNNHGPLSSDRVSKHGISEMPRQKLGQWSS